MSSLVLPAPKLYFYLMVTIKPGQKPHMSLEGQSTGRCFKVQLEEFLQSVQVLIGLFKTIVTLVYPIGFFPMFLRDASTIK